MAAVTSLTLSPKDKLEALRHLDEFHFWHALDDVRICQRCYRRITGWQIDVFEIPGARGALSLHCPTPNCESSPGEWIYADPVRAAIMHSRYRPSAPELAS